MTPSSDRGQPRNDPEADAARDTNGSASELDMVLGTTIDSVRRLGFRSARMFVREPGRWRTVPQATGSDRRVPDVVREAADASEVRAFKGRRGEVPRYVIAVPMRSRPRRRGDGCRGRYRPRTDGAGRRDLPVAGRDDERRIGAYPALRRAPHGDRAPRRPGPHEERFPLDRVARTPNAADRDHGDGPHARASVGLARRGDPRRLPHAAERERSDPRPRDRTTPRFLQARGRPASTRDVRDRLLDPAARRRRPTAPPSRSARGGAGRRAWSLHRPTPA